MSEGKQDKIVEAVLKVRGEMKRLKKADFNEHGNYSYVSIDNYYEKIAPLITQAGLLWRTKEVEWKSLSGQGRGKDRTYAISTFAVSLYCADQSFEDYLRVTVCAPIDGAQTAGQVFSYADKIAMRVIFAIPTGEKDADANRPEIVSSSTGDEPEIDEETGEVLTDRSRKFRVIRTTEGSHIAPVLEAVAAPAMPSAPAASSTPPAIPPVLGLSETQAIAPSTTTDGVPILDARLVIPSQAETVRKIFEIWLPAIKTRPKLRDWYTENVAAIEATAKFDPSLKQWISDQFNKRHAELRASASNGVENG